MIGHVPLIDPVPFAFAYASASDRLSARDGAAEALVGLVDDPAFASVFPSLQRFGPGFAGIVIEAAL